MSSDTRPNSGKGVLLIIVACALLLLTAISWPLSPLLPEEPNAHSPPYRLTGTRVGGIIAANVTWNATGNPYWVEEEITISQGAVLTIGPGVRVLFNPFPTFHNVTVDGILDIRGTVAEPVLMRWNVTPPPPWPWTLGAESDGSIFARNATMDHGHVNKGFGGTGMRGDLVLEQVDILSPGFVVQVHDARRAIITKSKIVTSGGTGIAAWDVELGEFTFNIVHSTEVPIGPNGIELRPNSNVSIYGNVIDGFSAGVEVIGGSRNIMENDISRCNFGIFLMGASDTLMMNNRLHSNGDAIFDNYGLRNVIAGNHVSGERGIVTWQTRSTVIRDNALVGNNVSMRIEDSSVVNVFDNTVEANKVGIWLDGGQSHSVYHNWIMYNDVQASDTSLGSYWDDLYPSGGNHWSDYVGDDLFKGPNQNVPGPDGFGDSWRLVPPNGFDRYPFYSVPAPGVPRELTAKAVGADIVLSWRRSPMADSYFLYTAGTQTGFDFSRPVKIGNVTSWTIPGAASSPGAEYYVMRAHNSTLNRTSATSNTAGKWTHAFPAGMSTFSLPLSPYPWVNYSSAGWVGNMSAFSSSTGARSVRYLDDGNWMTVPGDGDANRTMTLGEGYSVSFGAPTAFAFTGLPASVIDFGEWPPYPLGGFDPATTAREITAMARGDDVVVEWSEIAGFGPPNGTYEVYYSATPGGLRGYYGADYSLLTTVPATGLPRATAVHSGALANGTQWYYLVVPVRDANWRGSSTYSVGVVAVGLKSGYASVGLPLQPYANGTYLVSSASSLLGPDIRGVVWFDSLRQDWVAHASWMPPGMYDTTLEMVMAVQVSASAPARIVFSGV